MLISHEDWLRVGILMEELKGLFEELPDEELDNLKKSAIEAQKKVFMTVKKRFSPFWRILCIYKAMIYPQGSDSAP